MRAWDSSIPPLQQEVGEVVRGEPLSHKFAAILEYQLPYELRRPDVVLLTQGAVVVVELKGKFRPSQADLDQVSAYARDLKNYHRDCESRQVHAVLIPTQAKGYVQQQSGVHVCGPDALDELILRLDREAAKFALTPVPVGQFLDGEAYRPLPSIVEAARELFRTGELRYIKRAHTDTHMCLDTASGLIHQTAKARKRTLILVAGVPGSGKTLVGLQLAHAKFLDDLAVDRGTGKCTTPAVFLTGNGPLTRVLQHQLKSATADGKTFVRGVKEYVQYYSTAKRPVPPEHVLIYDEAQRAWDATQVQRSHEKKGGKKLDKIASEPELFIDFAERVPEWCAVVGLIGGGQEIHVGEEQGVAQWARAIQQSPIKDQWSVHAPPAFARTFDGVEFVGHPELMLDKEIRTHFASHLHRFVGDLVDGERLPSSAAMRNLLTKLEAGRYPIRMTRDFAAAKAHLRSRYGDDARRRFGLLLSARERKPERLGVGPSNRFFHIAPWLSDGEEATWSCRNLTEAATEFDIQGLELDHSLLVWGTDFRIEKVQEELRWTNSDAKKYVQKPEDSMRLRRNAYRVLMTRGREGLTIFVPRLPELDLTYEYLKDCGITSV